MPEIVIRAIKLLNLQVLRARHAPPPNIRGGGSVHPVGQPGGLAWGLKVGLLPRQVPTHPTHSAEASEIKFHGWVHGDTNSSSMCLWLKEEIRFH